MAASSINRLRSVMNDFTLYGAQQKPEEKEDEDVLTRLNNAKRNNVASTGGNASAADEQDVLARLNRAKRDNVASTVPQPSTDRTAPNRDEARITQSHGERFERQETEVALKKQTSGSAIKLPDGMSEIARTKQTPAQAAVSAADLESRLGQYSATMNDTERNMGTLLPGLDYAKSAVANAQTEWDKYERKLTLLDERLNDKSLSAKEHNDIVNEYNALLPYAQQAAKRLDNEISTYNSLSGQARQMQAQYNSALLQYQQALPEYEALSSRGKIDAEAMTREADKLVAEVKKLDRLANDRDELRVNRGMTPEEVGAWQQETFNLRTEIQEKTARARELYNQSDAAQKRYGQYQYNQLLGSVEKYQSDPDWKKLSATNKDMMGGEAKYEKGVVNYGKQDIDYAIINGDADTLNVWNGNNPIAVSKSYLTQMTDRERAAYNYLYAKKGKDAADAFLEELTPELNARQRGENQKKWGAYAEEDPWGTSAFSVLVSPAKAVSFFGQALDLIADGKIDQNAAYNQYSQIPSDIRGTVSKIAEEKWGKEGSFGYQTAMSMADFLFNSLITGEFFGAGSDLSGLASMFRPSLLIMGTGAAADTVIDLRDKGLDSTRAFVLGAAAGLAEMITEKYSLETMLSPELWADGLVKYWLKNMVAEGSEEVASTVLNWTADFLYDLVSGQNENEWQRDIRANIKNGMSARDATTAVVQDRIEGLAADALGGAISGGVMAGIGGGYHTLMNTDVAQAAQSAVAATRQDLREANAPMEAAPAPMESAPVEAPIQEATPRTALEVAVDKLAAGEQLTQNDAKRILNDPASVQALQDAGVMTGAIRNDSEGRQLVRQLVEQYAATEANTPPVPENLAQETQEEQQGDTTTPEESPHLRLKTAEETLTPPVPQRKLTLGNNTNTEVQNNGRQTETTAPAAEARTAEAGGRQSTRGDRGRGSGLGRFLVQSFRENYKGARAQQQQRNRANALSAQAAARGDLTWFSGSEITPEGSDEKIGAYAPEELWDDELKQTVKDYADKGVTLTPILDQIGMKEGPSARAYVSADGKQMWVQINHDRLSWQQLVAHEELHRELKVDPGLRAEIIRDLKSDPEIAKNYDKILRRYVEMYNDMGVTDAAKIEEEMLADYRAGFDMLKDTIGGGMLRARALESIRATEARYETNGGKTAPADVNEGFAEAKASVEPPYRAGTTASKAFEDGLNEKARAVYDMFLSVHEASQANPATMDVGSGKSTHAKSVPIADRFLTADEWNSLVKNNPEFAQAAKNIFAVIPENIRKTARLNDDGTITETGFEKHFKMARSLMQRLVDALPKGVVSSTVTLDGKDIQVARGRVTASVGGEEYRRALIEERRKLFEEGKLPTRSIESLSHDNWGAMGFLATNTKTIASGDFTTFCPQMYFNDGCWYCYRRSALTTGINNKLTAETVWYAGEILQLRQEDIDRLNEVGGLRIQSFGDWQSQYSTMLADLLIDAEKVGLQIKVITKEPSMIDTVALLKEQGLGKSLYFNLSADYTIERRGDIDNTNTEDALPMNPERPFLKKENAAGEEETWWKRALTVQEANEYRKQYPWVNTRIVATNADEFIRGLQDPTVDVVTGYHGTIRQYERVSSETGEVLMDVEPLGDSGMPRFAYNRKTGEWTMEYEGKTKYQKQLAHRIQAEGLEREYYTKSCCIFGRCAKCQGKCGSYARSFAVKNATNRDLDSVKYWQREMESGVDNPLLLSQQEGDTSLETRPSEGRLLQQHMLSTDRNTAERGRGRSPKKKVSRVRTHAFELGGLYNEVEAQMAENQPSEFTYDPVSEQKSMREALGRLKKDFDGEAEKLASSDQWGGSDLDTAMGILYQYRQIGRETGDYSLFNDWSHVIQQKGTKGGQFVQAFAKYSRTATGVAQKAAENLRDQHALTPAQQKRVEGHVNELMRAVDNFAEEAARGSVEDARGAKKGLKLPSAKQQYGDTQKAKDAMNVVKEIYDIFSRKTRRDHGAPVEDWTKLTGDQLASRIASRFNSGNKQRTTMQTILDDLLTYASEHALPKREGKTPRTATERITDYLNNREAYGEAWSEAKQVLREMYANDQEKLDALEAFLNSTISYNGEDLDQTMFRAILESADALGLTKDDILRLTAAGVNEGTIDRITEEFLRRIGSDDTNLRDTVARHITNLVMADNQEGRLGRMENEAAKELDLKLQNLLRESKQTKSSAANAIAQYLINDLGISGTDAAIAADHIASHYMERIEARAAQTLEKMFAEKGERVKPQQRDKLMDLIHLGGLTNANVEDAVVDALGIGTLSRAQQRQIMDAMAQFADTLDAIADDDLEGLRELIRLQAAARGTKLSSLTEEILSGETDAEYLRNFATTQLGLIAADFEARSAGEKISTLQVISHLLNARTAMRNVTSNQVFDIVDSTANNVGLLPDLIMSKITGQRTVGLEKSWFSQAKRQGAMKGMGRNILEVALDVDPEGRNRSKYGTGGRRTFSMASSGTVGRILSKAEEIMGYELNTTDEFHKGSVYAETLESLGRFVDAGYMTEEEAAEFAAQEALYRSFQDDTKVGAMLAGLKDVLNIIGTGKTSGKTIRGLPVHDFGLGDLVVKYTQVPGALIHRAIEYSPVGYLKAIYNIAQLGNAKSRGESTIKQQRNAALALGRATTGSGLIMLFTLLAKLGLLRRGDDEKDKNAAALKASQGLSGTQLNISAVGRLLSGESAEPQQGDVLHDIGFLEPLDSLMTIAALINNDPEIKNLNLYEMFRSAETAKELVGKSLQGIWLALEDTSAMQTLSNIYSTIRYHDEENDLPLYMQIPMEVASSSISGFIPAPIRQIAQATDTTYRDQYRSQDLLKQTGARVANAIPGLRKQLAPKITPLGEDKTYQEPWLNALNALVNPGNISVYQTDKVRDELLRVYEETGEGSMLPARNAPYSINIGGESYTLTPDERTEYLRIRGQEETKFVESLLTAYWYRNADADTKAAFLNSAKNIANDIAKSQWAAERGVTYHDTTYRRYLKMLTEGTRYADVIKAANEDLADTVEAGIPRHVWDATKAAFNDIANSDISSYEKGVQQRALISDLEDLDDQQKLLVYGDLANADSREEQFRTVMDTGLSFNETAKIFDQYSAYKSEDETRAAQDAKDFALWVDQRKGLTSEQKKVVKEQFKYWQMIPAEAERYEKYTGMGFAPEVASRIDSALSELKPLPGHDGVTDMQRTKAAIGALGKNASQSDQMKIVESFYGGSTTTKSGELSQWGQIKKVTGSGVTVEKTLKMIEDGSLDEYVNWMDWSKDVTPERKVDSNVYIKFQKTYNSTSSTYDETTGKAIKGQEKKDKVMAYIDGLNLTIDQKDGLYLTRYKESGLKDTPWHKGGGGSGKGKTYAPAKLRLPTTAERTAQTTPRLQLPSAPAAKPTTGGLKLR